MNININVNIWIKKKNWVGYLGGFVSKIEGGSELNERLVEVAKGSLPLLIALSNPSIDFQETRFLASFFCPKSQIFVLFPFYG